MNGVALPLERTVLLPPDPASAGAARRLVRDVLAQVARERWSESAELAVSELVTNAVLHAHTDVGLTVTASTQELRVDVRDGSSLLPGPLGYEEQSTTGRGLGLVGAVASEYGVTSLGEEGKVVWFVVDDRAEDRSEEALEEQFGALDWDLEELLADPAPASGRRTVLLRGLPPMLWLAARAHHDALLRELGLYLAEHDDVTVDLALADHARFTISTAVAAAVGEAAAPGALSAVPPGRAGRRPEVPELVDLPLELDPAAAPGFVALQDALDAGEQLAERGLLLVRPGLPEIVAVRDWVCEQVQSQLQGVPPGRWPGTALTRFETEVNARHGEPDWDLQAVSTSARGVVAADDANRILAISAPLAAALGWDPDELVGRRVVSLVPTALREGHVAGFTRHLTTGETHVLGVPLTLPVLRRDGTEVLCSFLVEQGPVREGRSLYLAWIEPVAQQETDADGAPHR